MTKTQSPLFKRWIYLAVGVFAMLFSGVLYAWSILNAPFKSDLFGWSESILSTNFTLTMCFFCLGAFFGSLVCKKIGPKLTLLLAGLLVGGDILAAVPKDARVILPAVVLNKDNLFLDDMSFDEFKKLHQGTVEVAVGAKELLHLLTVPKEG